MKAPLIVAVLLICAAPLYAQGQQPDVTKLKADAQKVVSIIKGDQAKLQSYCQIADLSDQIDQEEDRKKAELLVQKMNDLEKQLGPDYLALVKATARLKNPRRNYSGVLIADDLAVAFNDQFRGIILIKHAEAGF